MQRYSKRPVRGVRRAAKLGEYFRYSSSINSQNQVLGPTTMKACNPLPFLFDPARQSECMRESLHYDLCATGQVPAAFETKHRRTLH